jgi:hypothetical protein
MQSTIVMVKGRDPSLYGSIMFSPSFKWLSIMFPICSPSSHSETKEKTTLYLFLGVPKVQYYFFLTSQSKRVNLTFGVPTTN